MKLNGIVILIYGIIILTGGIMGHIKAASTASLASGIIFGLLLILSSGMIFLNKKSGLILALVSTFLLDGFFSFRFMLTKKLIPSGLLCFLSLLILVFLVTRMRIPKQSKKTT